MKIGDVVRSKSTRPDETATIVQVDISNRLDRIGKVQTRSKYVAKYSDGSMLHFAGASVNKTVFKVSEPDGQICLDEFLTEEEV